MTILITVLITWVILSAVYMIGEKFDLIYDDVFLFIFCAPLTFLIITIGGLGMILYMPVRNVIRPCPRERFEKVSLTLSGKLYKILPNLYFCTDPKAKKLLNKMFFVRVKK